MKRIIPRPGGLIVALLIATLACSGVALTPPIASAASATVTVTPPSSTPGGQITVSGSGFGPNEVVAVIVAPQPNPVMDITANASGAVPPTTVTLNAATFAPGTHTLTLYGSSTHRGAATQLDLAMSASVTPSTISPGEGITVSGTGFTPNEVVALIIAPQPNPVIDITANADGVVPATPVTLNTTVSSVGTHDVTLYGSSSRRQGHTSFTVAPAKSPSVVVTPTTSAPGGQIAVSGAGFAPHEAVAVIVAPQPNPVMDITADANGVVPPTNVRLNAATFAPGTHKLTLYGSASHRTASSNIDLKMMLTVTPPSSTPGGQITVSGSGFGPNEVVALIVAPQPNPVMDLKADANGVVPSTTVKLDNPAFTPGTHKLTLYGSSTHRSASVELTVAAASDATATLAVTPSSTNRGGLITISGSQWAPNEPLVVAIKGMSTPLATITTTAQGIVPPTGITIPYGVGLGARALQVTGSFSKHTLTTGITVHPLNPSISLSSGAANAGSPITVTGKGFGQQEQITLSLNGQALPTTPSVITTTNGAFTATITVPSGLLQGANTISASGNESRVSAAATLKGVLPVATTLYFAGASTMSGEHASLPILNTNAQTAHVELTFYYQHGAPGHGSIDVPANSRSTADLNEMAGANHAFGIKLVSDRAVTAQLRVARDGKDGYGLLGTATPSTTWYLAEGYTGLTFHETLALVNPGSSPASVRLRLLPFGGRPAREVTESVAAQSTVLVDVNSLMAKQSLSIIANATVPIVLERTLTFSKEGLGGASGYGATAKLGTNTPATSWLFAEGTTTTRFQTFLTILNPNQAPARVTASFYGQTGGSLGSRTIVVAGLARANLKLNDFLHASGIASVVTSNLPVVVERPMYFGSPNAAGIAGSDVFGRNGADLAWAFPGGNTSGRNDYLLIYNPSSKPAEIDATFYGSNGTTMTRRLSVAPMVRYNVNVNALVPSLAAQHGVTLRAVNGVSFVAEQTIFAPNFSALHSTQGFAL